MSFFVFKIIFKIFNIFVNKLYEMQAYFIELIQASIVINTVKKLFI